MAAVHADLDGSVEPDTLLLWRPRVDDVITGVPAAGMGGVAILDDGTSILLEDPPATWPSSEFGMPSLFEPPLWFGSAQTTASRSSSRSRTARTP